MMFLLGVSYLILSSYHTAWLLLGSTVNTLRSGISISENPQNANFAKAECVEGVFCELRVDGVLRSSA
jgi:hypothetical protein